MQVRASAARLGGRGEVGGGAARGQAARGGPQGALEGWAAHDGGGIRSNRQLLP